MTQYGFFYDQGRCVNCQSCTISCKAWNDLPAGPGKWCRMFEWETGAFPETRLNYLFAPCYHCENPVCVDAANGAMFKEAKYGAVLIDPARNPSPDLRAAAAACPYGAITFRTDSFDEKAQLCTMCVDRLEQGNIPACVGSCAMRALDFGPLADMITKYGTLRQLEGMPPSNLTNPSIVFKPHNDRKLYVPYDVAKARALHQQRMGLPNVYNSVSDLTDLPPGLVSRATLVMKARNVAEEARTTVNDD